MDDETTPADLPSASRVGALLVDDVVSFDENPERLVVIDKTAIIDLGATRPDPVVEIELRIRPVGLHGSWSELAYFDPTTPCILWERSL